MIDINNLKTADDLRAALEGLSVERRMIILSDDFAGISILSERLKEATEVRTELLVDAARDVLEAARVSAAQALSNEIGPAFNQDDMTDDQREIFEETMFQIAANQWTGYMEAQIMRLTNSGHGDQVKVFKGYMGTLLLALQLHCPLYLTYPSGKKAGELVYVALNRVRKYTEDFRDMMANINAEKQRAAAKRAGLTVVENDDSNTDSATTTQVVGIDTSDLPDDQQAALEQLIADLRALNSAGDAASEHVEALFLPMVTKVHNLATKQYAAAIEAVRAA